VVDPSSPFAVDTARFAIRAATLADAEAIARVYVDSWRSSYRGILPDALLDRIDVGQRTASRRRILRDAAGLNLVAYETTHRELVGLCDAGPSRRPGPWAGEVYAIYLLHHARRHGLGRDFFARVMAWLRARQMTSMIVWVLENNPHARRFYEALGGRVGPRVSSRLGDVAVVEVAYVWDRL
jgi:GNAT superfamily N-acetyltransferase